MTTAITPAGKRRRGVPAVTEIVSAIAEVEATVESAGNAIKSTIQDTHSTDGIPKFSSDNHLNHNLYEPNQSLPSIDESVYQARLEQIKGQQRAVDLVKQNLTLNRSVLQAEGLSILCETEGVSNDIKRQDLSTTRVKLQQSQVKTAIEQSKLGELNHDLNGYTQQAEIKGSLWNVKLDNLRLDLQQAQNLLEAKKNALLGQFKG